MLNMAREAMNLPLQWMSRRKKPRDYAQEAEALAVGQLAQEYEYPAHEFMEQVEVAIPLANAEAKDVTLLPS